MAQYSKSDLVPLILDIGCGDGKIALPAMGIGIRIIGIDLSPFGLKSAYRVSRRVNEKYKIQFLVADAENLPFKNQLFSRAYCIGTFEYFYDLKPTFREAQRILIPKGEILFNFRNERSVRKNNLLGQLFKKLLRRNRSGIRRRSQDREWKTQYHSPEHVKHVLQGCQFEVTRIHCYFVFMPSDIERLHKLLGFSFSKIILRILKWLDRILGMSLIGTRLANVIAVVAYKSK